MVRRTALGFVAAMFAAWALAPTAASADTPVVVQADLNGDINNIMSAYIGGVVARAESENASALLVVVNTPGGISTSMDEIVTSLLNAKVPVIVFVYPTGARAASAGLFVAQSADIVAMAPGTNIGSAHPIQSTGADIGGDLGAKVLNDAVTRVRNLAALHNRNADWCEDAVRNSVNINAEEAVSIHVADREANDPAALLKAVDGTAVTRPSGQLTLHTAGARIEDIPMAPWQVFLNALIDPTVAALLMLLAAYGLITELQTPGAIFPGVIGGIAGILAIVSLANLPVTIAGILLMMLAVLLFIADLKANTHGILTTGGVFALVLGMAFLVDSGPVGLGVNPWAIVTAAVLTIGFFTLFLRMIVAARRRPIFAGSEALIGVSGQAREELAPEGLVFVGGALWKAVANPSPIHAGSAVRVTGRKGLQLEVVAGEPAATKEKN
jgi:membrane-bound serine protease (ClpP class)